MQTFRFPLCLAVLINLSGCPEAPKAPGQDGGSAIGAEVPAEALHDSSLATAQAPEVFQARFETTAGDFVVEVHRDWAPQGADRFYNLVSMGYYDGCAFFRVISGFMAQVGIHPDPSVNEEWYEARIEDDPVTQPNRRGYVTFATAGPNTRTTQVFFNFGDNRSLDRMGFAPFGQVVEGMDVVDQLYAGYGEGAPRGRGPDQGQILRRGSAYLEANFPELSVIERASIVTDDAEDNDAEDNDAEDNDAGADVAPEDSE